MIPNRINVGYLGENLSRYIDIDISDYLREFPNTFASLMVRRHGEKTPYLATTVQNGNVLRWIFTAVDTSVRGYGEAQIVFSSANGEVIGKSETIETLVQRSIVTDADSPEPYKPWIDQVIATKAAIDRSEREIEADRVEIEKNRNDAYLFRNDAVDARDSARNHATNAHEDSQVAYWAAEQAMDSEAASSESASRASSAATVAILAKESAVESAEQAKNSADSIKGSADTSRVYASIAENASKVAKTSADNAKASETAVATNANKAAESERNAKTYYETAVSKAVEATNAATLAQGYSASSKTNADNSYAYAQSSASSASKAEGYATVAGGLESRVAALENKPSGGGVDLDPTLTASDKAAPADKVGEIKSNLEDLAEEVGLQKEEIASKQGKIDDLDSIRDGAEKGATALQANVNSGKGIYLSNGDLAINAATDNQIDAKSNNLRPLTSLNINRSVRAGLISNSQITDADKTDICRTIGAEMPLRHIRLVTINDAGISDVNINTDENGNAFALTEIEIYAYVGSTSGTKTISLAINTTKTETTGGYNIIKLQNVGNNNIHAVISKRTYWRAFAEISGTGGEAASQSPGTVFVSNRGASGVRNNEWSTASQIAINIDATTFPVGTNFDIWGR